MSFLLTERTCDPSLQDTVASHATVLFGRCECTQRRGARSAGKDLLCQELGRKEGVFKSMAAQDDFVAAGELIDAVEDLIPAILWHQADERIQTDDGLLIEMVENGCGESIGRRRLQLNIRI